MHTLGNDFIIVNNIQQNIKLSKKKIKFLSNRNFGIGFDQMLIITSYYRNKNTFFCRMFNADGSEIEQCGNILICLAIFLKNKKLTKKKYVLVQIRDRKSRLKIEEKNIVTVNMGFINFCPKKISSAYFQRKRFYKIKTKNNKFLKFDLVSIGNPHCVVYVENIKKIKIKQLGAEIESHKNFPEKINVNFMQIINHNHIILRVYERGVGETLACGSGACASVASGIINNYLSNNVKVEFLNGYLNVFWKGKINKPIYLKGQASNIFDGFFTSKY